MTLKGHYALCFKTYASFGAHDENLKDLYFQRRRCSLMTLVSGNNVYAELWIFAGFLGDEASNDSGVFETVDFQGFLTLRVRHLRK